MISIVEHIEYLVVNNDCVVIPGWGALISQYTPARIFDKEFIIDKPHKALSFNASINHNDGLLANSLMRRNGLTYNAAMALINQEVVAMKRQLEITGEVGIGRIGCFRKNDEGNSPIFNPYENESKANDYYGLLPLRIKTLSTLDAEVEEVKEPEAKKRDHHFLYIPINRTYLKIAASIIVLLVLAITLTTPISRLGKQNFAGINVVDVISNPGNSSNESHELAIMVPKEAAAKQNKPAIDKEKNVKKEKNDISSDKTKHEVNDGNNDNEDATKNCKFDNGDFQVIVATFYTEKKANKFIKLDGNDNLRISKHGKKFRVIAATGSFKDMTNLQHKVTDRYPGVWVSK